MFVFCLVGGVSSRNKAGDRHVFGIKLPPTTSSETDPQYDSCHALFGVAVESPPRLGGDLVLSVP